MADNIKQIQFPYYIRRSVYFIKRYFIVKKPGALFRELRAIRTKTLRSRYGYCGDYRYGIRESDLTPFLKNSDFKETPEKCRLDIFFDNMLSYYRIDAICEAFQNLDRYKDLDYPANFKLMPGHADYLGTRPEGYELLL